MDELDKHISLVPCFTGMKRFARDIQNIEQMTARKYADIMKVFRFNHQAIEIYPEIS